MIVYRLVKKGIVEKVYGKGCSQKMICLKSDINNGKPSERRSLNTLKYDAYRNSRNQLI